LKRSNRLVLLIGALLAVVAFVGVVLLLGSQNSGTTVSASPTPPTTAQVVVAKVDIPIGTTVTADTVDLETVPIAAANIAGDTIPAVGLAIGQVVRHPITAGAIVRFGNFVDNGTTSNVTDNLPAGLRAIAVQVDQITGVGTLVHTGDNVDVIISLLVQPVAIPSAGARTSGPLPSIAPQTTVKLIIQNAKVVGTLLPPPPAAAAPAANAGAQPVASPSAQPVASQPTTSLSGQQEIVILAVTADQAEVIRFSQLNDQAGSAVDRGQTSIAVVLRSPKDAIAVDPSGVPIPGASAVVPPLEKTDGAILKILIDKYGVLPPDILIRF
jgi:Flp pilus assembly protein CpaB